MPIPNFDHNNVIPPHLGDPTDIAQVSPYTSNTLELCQRFAFSRRRKEILLGLLSFREKMNNIGIVYGFQWLDGSFLEHVEVSENRAPNDLDLVTFYALEEREVEKIIEDEFIEFADPVESKKKFLLDHYIVDLRYHPTAIVENVRYWTQLFSHSRNKVWKGMVRLELNTPDLDLEAKDYLSSLDYE